MSIDWRVVPIETWPGEMTEDEDRKSHPFRKSVASRWGSGTRTVSGIDWTATMDLLDRELRMIEAENVVLQMAVTNYHIRNDGWIRANASPEHPGVILTFHSRKLGMDLSYPCDTFRDWQANVRAIALALEALRKVDRYGVTKTGQQYRGWRALPSGERTRNETIEHGRELVRRHGSVREALFATHPDHGGNEIDFHAVQQARAHG